MTIPVAAALLSALALLPVAARAQSAPAPAAPAARRWTLEQFRSLRWLEGRWRGQLPNGGFFYEERAFTDDLTLATRTFAGDSTFTSVRERGEVTFRGGVIASGGGRRQVISLDVSHVLFVSAGSAGTVRFDRRSNDHWTATLSSSGAPDVVYEMHRKP